MIDGDGPLGKLGDARHRADCHITSWTVFAVLIIILSPIWGMILFWLTSVPFLWLAGRPRRQWSPRIPRARVVRR